MTPRELASIPTYPTQGTAPALEDPKTREYLAACFNRYFKGDFGDISEEDTAANNADLAAGDGHILARYEGKYKLEGDLGMRKLKQSQASSYTRSSLFFLTFGSQ